MRHHLLILSFSIFLGVGAASIGLAEDWSKPMFSETAHDFGTVARGAKTEYKFTIENIYEEDVQILSVESSCGCTTPTVNKKLLKTWDKAELTATVDTRKNLGRKDATITVKFSPSTLFNEVQVQIHVNIRSDVVIQPGVLQFNTIAQGIAMKQKVSVSYAGRLDWKILRAECVNPHLEPQIKELPRNGGQIDYELSVVVKDDAPAGYLHDQIVLITNDSDPNAAKLPVPVEGLISPSLTARPSPLFMGIVEEGQTVTKQLVVQGKSPFKIKAAKSNDPRFQCKLPDEAKPVQVLPITFDAKDASGRITGKLHIETDLPDVKPLDVEVSVQVAPKIKEIQSTGE